MISKIKKIIFVITRSQWGGAQRYLYDIATHLPRDEFSIRAIVGNEGPLVKKLEDVNIPVYRFATSRGISFINELKTFFTLFSIFRNERPDIIHLNSSKVGVLGAAAGWLAGVPKIIFTAHGWAFNEERPWWQKFLIIFFSWLSGLIHHHIICVSQYDFLSSKKLPIIHKKCITIKNGIPEIVFVPKQKARLHFKNIHGIHAKRGAIWIGTLSDLTTNKGLIHLIYALSTLKEKNWICIITGEGEEHSYLKSIIKKLALEERIFLTGHIQDGSRLLRAFDIITLTSIKEGLPYLLIEAGQAGCAVLASHVGGVPEIIDNGKSGILVAPKSEKEISNALEELIKHSALRRRLAKELQQKIAKDFSFNIMLEETTKVYRS